MARGESIRDHGGRELRLLPGSNRDRDDERAIYRPSVRHFVAPALRSCTALGSGLATLSSSFAATTREQLWRSLALKEPSGAASG